MQIRPIVLATIAITATIASMYLLLGSSPNTKRYGRNFMAHKAKFNKHHVSKEDLTFRLSVYASNMEMINKHNASDSSFKMGEGPFTDMTFEEFKAKYLMTKEIPNELDLTTEPLQRGRNDWKARGMVSEVKNQEACGSCWAFSTTGSLESAYLIQGKEFKTLSEQELVDCSRDYGNYGCNGGIMSAAFDYIIDNWIATEKDYPYTARDGTCHPNQQKERFEARSYKTLRNANVNGLMDMLDKQPVSVAIEVQQDFMHYSSGVYQSLNKRCGSRLNHGVLAAGYDMTASKPYFLVKNSWGELWGEEGFIKMAIGKGSGTCGIANPAAVAPSI